MLQANEVSAKCVTWMLRSHIANPNLQKKGGLDMMALHEFVVRVSVFLKAVAPGTTLESEDAEMFSQYASLLAQQGLLVAAAKYCQ